MKINYSTYFKWGVILFIFLAGMWFACNRCGHSAGSKSGSDTLSIKHDTLIVNHRDTVYFDNPVPYKVIYVQEKILHDTLEKFETVLEHVDSARILEQYLAKRYYSNTSPVEYGTVIINDTVTQNRITGRSVILNQNIPEITKTVTLRDPKRNVFYAGIVALGNAANLPYASGLTFDLKLKNDMMIGGGGLLTRDKAMYMVELKAPIRLKRR
jgi:hypothetical protein